MELSALEWNMTWGKSLRQSSPQSSKLELKWIYPCFYLPLHTPCQAAGALRGRGRGSGAVQSHTRGGSVLRSLVFKRLSL